MMQAQVQIIEDCRKAISGGKLIGLPTETVYGLGAPVDRADLIDKVFAIKQRPTSNPLIVHVASIAMAKRYSSHWPELAQTLAHAFWPGPLSLLLPKSTAVSDQITAGSGLVAIRMPANKLTCALIDAFDCGFVAPSANPYQKLSPTNPEMVRTYFSAADVHVISGEPCDIGIESTVVEITSDHAINIVRPGMITEQDARNVIGTASSIQTVSQNHKSSPGQSQQHYQPKVPLVIGLTQHISLRQAKLALQEKTPQMSLQHGIEYPLNNDVHMIAKTLYQKLHTLSEKTDFILINISPTIKTQAQNHGILDRLQKAATVVI